MPFGDDPVNDMAVVVIAGIFAAAVLAFLYLVVWKKLLQPIWNWVWATLVFPCLAWLYFWVLRPLGRVLHLTAMAACVWFCQNPFHDRATSLPVHCLNYGRLSQWAIMWAPLPSPTTVETNGNGPMSVLRDYSAPYADVQEGSLCEKRHSVIQATPPKTRRFLPSPPYSAAPDASGGSGSALSLIRISRMREGSLVADPSLPVDDKIRSSSLAELFSSTKLLTRCQDSPSRASSSARCVASSSSLHTHEVYPRRIVPFCVWPQLYHLSHIEKSATHRFFRFRASICVSRWLIQSLRASLALFRRSAFCSRSKSSFSSTCCRKLRLNSLREGKEQQQKGATPFISPNNGRETTGEKTRDAQQRVGRWGADIKTGVISAFKSIVAPVVAIHIGEIVPIICYTRIHQQNSVPFRRAGAVTSIHDSTAIKTHPNSPPLQRHPPYRSRPVPHRHSSVRPLLAAVRRNPHCRIAQTTRPNSVKEHQKNEFGTKLPR